MKTSTRRIARYATSESCSPSRSIPGLGVSLWHMYSAMQRVTHKQVILMSPIRAVPIESEL